MEPLSNEQDSGNQPALSPFSFEGARTSSSDSQNLASPVSTHSADLGNRQSEARAEDIISPGPVRTVQLQRQSVIGGKPRFVITDTQQHAWDPRTFDADNERSLLHSDTDLITGNASKTNAWTWLVLTITTVIISSLFAFLCYLWISRNSTWHRIVSSDWIVRAVTIAATFMWLAVELQAVIALFMLYRCHSSNTTMSKEYAYLSRKTSPRSASLLSHASLLLVVCLVLHFTSTILLSDFTLVALESGIGSAHDTAYGLSDGMRLNISRGEVDYSGANIGVIPVFAESTETPVTLRPGIDDTGGAIRAFLPFSQPSEGGDVARYDGMATLVDSRVVCVAPNVENITYVSTGPSTSPSSPAQRILGSVAIEATGDGDLELGSGNAGGLGVDCALQLAQVKGESPISMCPVSQSGNAARIRSQLLGEGLQDALAFVLVDHTENSTIPVSGWVGEGNSTSAQEITISSWDTSRAGAWTNLTYAPNPIFSMQLSLCFVAAFTANARVPVRMPASTRPHVNDIPGMLSQLGVPTGLSQEMRRIMLLELAPGSTFNSIRADHPSPIDDSKIFGQNATYGLCSRCGSYDNDGTAHGIPYILSTVFQRALQESSSPARALQAMFTLARSAQYYSR